MTTETKTLSDLQHDATGWHGMLQGLDLLLNETSEASPLHNAIHSICGQTVKLAGTLSVELDHLETEARK